MKLKYLYLGLLSTLVIASQAEAMQKKMLHEPEQMKKHITEATHDLGDKPKDLQALVEPGHDVKTGITHTNTHLGAGYQTAADAVGAIGGAHGGAGIVGGAAANAGVLEAGLNDPDAKTAAGLIAGNHVPDDSVTKSANLLARLNAAAHGIGNGNNHAIVYHGPYTSIEAWVTAQGF